MKVTFITPAIGKEAGKPYIRSWQVMEPLTIATLKALTPPGIQTEFFDDRIELIDYSTVTDLVAITVETYTACRAYAVAERFRARGVPVVMGGYHAMSVPEEVRLHADAVCVGSAETVWQRILSDAAQGKLRKIYRGGHVAARVMPDRSIYGGRRYSALGLVETGRGCRFSCSFCSITACYRAGYHPRPIADVVEDIRLSGKKYFFFIDDNVVADPLYAVALCKAIAPLGIRWAGQGSLTMAKHPELLSWLRKSGCVMLLVGLESLDRENLRQMRKEWSLLLGERDELIGRIHAAGISIYATFVFGFDGDTPATFGEVTAFARRHGFYFTAFNQVTPFPGTPFYEQLRKEKRLLADRWWLDNEYHYGELPFHPRGMSHGEVTSLCVRSRREFFSIGSICRRWLMLLRRNRDPFLSYMFLVSNLLLRREVSPRLALPIGRNLDELPK